MAEREAPRPEFPGGAPLVRSSLGVMAEPGDVVPAPRIGPTAVELVAPATCPVGHPLPRHHWQLCDHGGHHMWLCEVCGGEIHGACSCGG